MAQYRWSNGYSKAWEFEAEDSQFEAAALDALIPARMESRRRVHDGRTHRNYWDYPQLQLHMKGNRSAWVEIARVPCLMIWDHLPEFIQAPHYDTAAWYESVLKTRDYLARLGAFIGSVSSVVTDVVRRPNEWNCGSER